MDKQMRIFLILGAVGLALIAGVVGLVVYALLKVSVITLRWWAGVATLATTLLPLLTWWLGTREARARLAGIDQGIDRVTQMAVRAVDVAQRTAQVRVSTARQLRQQPARPAVQQVFLPGLGLPTGDRPIILPADADRRDEEVEL